MILGLFFAPLPSPPPDLPPSPPTQGQSFSGTRLSASLSAFPYPPGLSTYRSNCSSSKRLLLGHFLQETPHLPQDPSTWASPLGPLRIPSSACLSDSPRDVSSLRTGTMDNCVPGKMCSHHFQKAQAYRLGHPAHWTLNIKAARPLVDPA